MKKGIHWGWLVLVALVFALGSYAMFPQVELVDNTDYAYNDVLAAQVSTLEGDLSALSEEKVSLESDLEATKISLAESEATVVELRELPIESFSFGKWILGLLQEAEDDAELTFNGTLYEGEDGEWDLDANDLNDIDARDCDIVFDDKDFGEEMTLYCDDIEIETEDDDDIRCDFEVVLDNDEYDEAEVTNCVAI